MESLRNLLVQQKKFCHHILLIFGLSFPMSLSSKLSDNLSLSVSYCRKDGLFMVQWSKYFAVEEHIHPPLLLKLKINDVILVCVFCKINDIDVAAVTYIGVWQFSNWKVIDFIQIQLLLVIYHIKANLKSHFKVSL